MEEGEEREKVGWWERVEVEWREGEWRRREKESEHRGGDIFFSPSRSPDDSKSMDQTVDSCPSREPQHILHMYNTHNWSYSNVRPQYVHLLG